MSEAEQPDYTTLTVQLLSAYFSNNTVPSDQLSHLIKSTRSALVGETEPATSTEPELVPAVTARKSLASPDHILSMIDGKPYKSLKRHLSAHGLTPAEYRTQYKLPKDYPMVAPAYSEQRRTVAKRLGLGRRRSDTDTKVAETSPVARSAEKVSTGPAVKPQDRAQKIEAVPATGKPPRGGRRPRQDDAKSPNATEIASETRAGGATTRQRKQKAKAAESVASARPAKTERSPGTPKVAQSAE